MKDVIKILESIREGLHLKKGTFASELGIRFPTYSRWLAGEHYPDIDELCKKVKAVVAKYGKKEEEEKLKPPSKKFRGKFEGGNTGS